MGTARVLAVLADAAGWRELERRVRRDEELAWSTRDVGSWLDALGVAGCPMVARLLSTDELPPLVELPTPLREGCEGPTLVGRRFLWDSDLFFHESVAREIAALATIDWSDEAPENRPRLCREQERLGRFLAACLRLQRDGASFFVSCANE